MQENNEQIRAAATETTEDPAGEMLLPKRSRIGARALALSGLAVGVGLALANHSPDTTINPLFG